MFDFVDLKSGARWTLQPNDGPVALVDGFGGAARAGHQGRRLCSPMPGCYARDGTRRIGDLWPAKARCGTG